jgi:colanic acid biosynthesis glycosyl transferase WcaI
LPLDENHLRSDLGLRDIFSVSYSGNMGLGHDFDTVIEAMSILRHHPVHWLFIGDGPRKPEIEAAVAARQLTKVTFLPSQPRSQLPLTLTVADASLVTLQAGLAGMLVPSKLYGILAAGLPVIYVGPPEGRVADVIRENRVGISANNGDAEGLARAVLELMNQKEARREMGLRARELFNTRFNRAQSIESHHALLMRLTSVS